MGMHLTRKMRKYMIRNLRMNMTTNVRMYMTRNVRMNMTTNVRPRLRMCGQIFRISRISRVTSKSRIFVHPRISRMSRFPGCEFTEFHGTPEIFESSAFLVGLIMLLIGFTMIWIGFNMILMGLNLILIGFDFECWDLYDCECGQLFWVVFG